MNTLEGTTEDIYITEGARQRDSLHLDSVQSGDRSNNRGHQTYTGHCPTLKFQYGRSYGSNTKDILRNLREKEIYKEVHRHRYRENDPGKVILTPVSHTKDFAMEPFDRCPKYILGYSGFIPTLNFRYGKSFGRTANDSVVDFVNSQTKLRERMKEKQYLFQNQKVPKMVPIRNKDEVRESLNVYQEDNKFKDRELSPDCPPIAGYTGHIPKVKGNEQSLSQRYSTVVKRGLSLLKEERENRKDLLNTTYKIQEIIAEGKPRYTYVK
ncbi:hypothetical protein FQA39_LY17894 [Lamprigera yunnana]|nr:hypothetical protein FQA39_LY17894 [Lamprigera yunnana]